MSKRKCIADETLLTFCPPAPWARIADISISDSGMLSRLLMVIKTNFLDDELNDYLPPAFIELFWISPKSRIIPVALFNIVFDLVGKAI